jgi:hypothetical protein
MYSLQILLTTCIARNLVTCSNILCPCHKTIARRQLRVLPSFEAFRVIVVVHCEISDLVVCWLPTANCSIVNHLTYGPLSSNGAKETSAYSIRRSHQKCSQSNDLLWGHNSATLRSKRKLYQCVRT